MNNYFCEDCGFNNTHNTIGHYYWAFINIKREFKMKEQTMTRRFYSTKSAIEHPPIMKLLVEATADAVKRCEDGHEEYYVVEVVRIVRRTNPKPPIEVVDVK